MDDAVVERRPPFGDNPVVGERGAITRRSILDCALEVFGTHGYHGTRVELITEAAGCSRPAFYQYFASKQEVFWHLAAGMAGDMDALAAQLGTVTPDAEGLHLLDGWLGDLLDLCTEYTPVLLAFQAAAREQAPSAAGARDVGQRLGDAIVRSYSGEAPAVDLTSLSRVTASIVMRAAYYWHLGLGGVSRAEFLDGLAQTVHRFLHGAVPGVNTTGSGKAPPARPLPRPRLAPEPEADRLLRPRGVQTRRKLLDAGVATLPVLGYHETRVDDIVATAGVSHGTFYRYFDSKDALFQALAAEAATRMVDLLAVFPDTTRQPGADTGSGDESLPAWLRSWFAAYRDNGGILSAWQEIGAHDPTIAEFSVEVAAVAFDRLVRIVHRRGFGNPTVDAIVLLSVIERAPYTVLVLGYVDEASAVDASALLLRRALFAGGRS
jgi:AcrR family transcriptional regulator